MTAVFDELDRINAHIAGLRRQLENAKVNQLLKQSDPVAALCGDTGGRLVSDLEGRIAALVAERDRLFSDTFAALTSEKKRLEKELKAARAQALEKEWFDRLKPEDKLVRLGAMRAECRELENELKTF